MTRRKTVSENSKTGSSDGDCSSHSQQGAVDERQPNGSHTPSKQMNASVTSAINPGTLYVVATPIGNTADISLRALDVLRQVNTAACEDTRVTSKLLARHGIKVSLSTYHEHNAEKARRILMERLNNGDSVALVSDAGTPLVSDPGYKLVRACIDANIPVTVVPGASAVLSSLVLSGLPTDRFMFVGFMPPKKGQRITALREFINIPATLVFMESARRLAASLTDMAEVFGERNASVSREITKLYEETRRGTLSELAKAYEDDGPPKGEVMVVVSAPLEAAQISEADIDAMLYDALQRLSLRDAVREVAEASGQPRQSIYQRALELNKGH